MDNVKIKTCVFKVRFIQDSYLLILLFIKVTELNCNPVYMPSAVITVTITKLINIHFKQISYLPTKLFDRK